jgi:hypothetical protein
MELNGLILIPIPPNLSCSQPKLPKTALLSTPQTLRAPRIAIFQKKKKKNSPQVSLTPQPSADVDPSLLKDPSRGRDQPSHSGPL